MDDDELFTLIKADGASRDRAISQLRAILLRGLGKSLNHRYGQPFNAEDIVQEALMKVLHSLDKFEGRSKFTTWAMTVATRVGISALRRKYHQDVSLEPFSAADGYSIEIPVFDEPTLSNTESRAKILSLLQSLIETELTDRQRLATRAFLSDFATDEIAEQLNMNRNAVYKLIHDARRKLKDGFERAGLTSQAIFDELSEGNQ
ncbi:MAG: sigma-70 family RNA polymerase sigma factor [Planctomycetaceae bacterium]|jgi:RNA polymerase sigma factor (sigma-70 family)|nr:sigma-70 family RNA polymerase sigma factor [Planctomycetaceae bacterium]